VTAAHTRLLRLSDIIDQPPPAAVASERELIGCLILRPELLDEQLDLVPSDFADEACSAIFGAMHALRGESKPINTTSLVQTLTARGDLETAGGYANLATLASGFAVSAHLPYYIGEIRKAAERRRIYLSCLEVIREVHTGDLTPGTHARVLADLEIAGQTDRALPIRSCRDLADHPTPLREPIIHGLQRQGETLNVVAPSKTGKSWLGIGLGLSVATGIPWPMH
jgi:hypothetical protein